MIRAKEERKNVTTEIKQSKKVPPPSSQQKIFIKKKTYVSFIIPNLQKLDDDINHASKRCSHVNAKESSLVPVLFFILVRHTLGSLSTICAMNLHLHRKDKYRIE